MFGVAGMSECVTELLHSDSSRTATARMTRQNEADKIMVKIANQVNRRRLLEGLWRPLHPARTGWFLRPAGRYPGVRIKVGA